MNTVKRPSQILALLFAASCCIAWLNPTRDRIAEANRLFKHGKFDDAIGKYGEALVDDPDSPLLNFNMGDAKYKAGKYAEAMASYSRVRTGDDDPRRTASTAYNLGNTQYRLGAAAEGSKPQDALAAYAGALAAYRRALGANPADQDAKFNYEFVSKKLDDLKQKLEEQKKQQQQHNEQDKQQQDKQQQDKQQQNEQQQQKQGEQPQEQQKQEGQTQQAPDQAQPKPDDENKDQQQRAQPPEDETKTEQQAAAGGTKSATQKDQLSRQEAAAVIDTARNEELQPDEFARQAQRAAVAEPAQDW